MEVKDLRGSERFIAGRPFAGIFGATSVSVVNLSSQGVQIEHPMPLRLGTKGRLAFKLDGVSVAASGISIWSHLSKTPNQNGKYLYRSGVRIEMGIDEFTSALQKLIDDETVVLDTDSMSRKQQRLIDRQAERKNLIKVVHTTFEIPADQVLLVQHARERLRAHPQEALKWYNRAKFASPEMGTEAIPNREEVLAVWEYLERTIEVNTIVQVFEKTRVLSS